MLAANYLNLSTAFGTVPCGKMLPKKGDKDRNPKVNKNVRVGGDWY